MYYMRRQLTEGVVEIKSARILKKIFVPDEISVVGFFDSQDEPKSFPYRDIGKISI
jgi:hypothetical protein